MKYYLLVGTYIHFSLLGHSISSANIKGVYILLYYSPSGPLDILTIVIIKMYQWPVTDILYTHVLRKKPADAFTRVDIFQLFIYSYVGT